MKYITTYLYTHRTCGCRLPQGHNILVLARKGHGFDEFNDVLVYYVWRTCRVGSKFWGPVNCFQYLTIFEFLQSTEEVYYHYY